MHPQSITVERTCIVCGTTFRTTEKRIAESHGRYCSRACYLNRSAATATERFWAKVDKAGECWLWTARTDTDGYGKFEPSPGKIVFAHRYAYELQIGPVPPGKLVCHTCDTPPCQRGDHLFASTPLGNMQDKMAKGRGATGDRNGARLHPERMPHGEQHGNAKLTSARAQEIRRIYAVVGHATYRDLARLFGVSETTIGNIVRHDGWQHD